MKGYYLKAESIYDDAIEANPSDPKAYINKASLLLRILLGIIYLKLV